MFVRFAGFDVITLANNHINGFGSKGLNFTAHVLKEAGLSYFGVSYRKFNSSQVIMSLLLLTVPTLTNQQGFKSLFKTRGWGGAGRGRREATSNCPFQKLRDNWNRLGHFRRLQLVDSYLGNHGPIITYASYPNDPRNQIAERLCSVFPEFLEWPMHSLSELHTMLSQFAKQSMRRLSAHSCCARAQTLRNPKLELEHIESFRRDSVPAFRLSIHEFILLYISLFRHFRVPFAI